LRAASRHRADAAPFWLSNPPHSKDPETAMSDHVYKIVELVGSSRTSIEDAINTAINKAGETIRLMRWFQVVETRGHIENGKVAHYQVTLKVGFTMDDKS
jgi:dodecin